MAYDIGPKISLKGEAEFNKALEGINLKLKENGSALKALQAQYDGQEKSVEGLTRLNDALQKQYDTQNQKLKLYQDQLKKLTDIQTQQKQKLDEATKAFGENSKEAQNAQKDYDSTAKQISKLNTAINETEAFCNKAKAQIQANADEIEQMGDKYAKAGEKLQNAGAKVTDIGKKASVASAGVAAVGVAAGKAWSELDEAYDNIAAGTGATGEALKELQANFDDVYGSFPADSADVSAAIADINTRFGLTGQALEDASTKFLQFSAVNGTEVSASIESVAKAMGDAQIPASELGSVLDRLTTASQASGLPVDQLADALSKNGVNMRQLGYDTNETIALLTTFEKSGVDTSTVLTGMKTAVKNCAKEGTDAKTEMSKMFDSIQNGSATAADAQELFGSRAGAAIYQYASEGKLNISDMMDVIDSSSGQLGKSFEEMQDPADQAKVAMNNLKIAGAELAGAIQEVLAPVISAIAAGLQQFAQWFKALPAPIQKLIAVIGMLVAAIGPVVLVVGTIMEKGGALIAGVKAMGPMLTGFVGTVKTVCSGIGSACTGLFNLIMAHPVIAVITAIIAALVLLYTKCEWFRDLVNGIFQGLYDFFVNLGDNIQQGWQDMCDKVREAWDNFVAWLKGICDKVINFFKDNWASILLMIVNPFAGAFTLVLNNFGEFKGKVAEFANKIMNKLKETIGSLGSKAFSWGKDLVDGFVDGIKSMWDTLTRWVNKIADKVSKYLHFSVPEEGPLSDFDESGSDMMQLLIDGIKSKQNELANTVRSVAESMQMESNVLVANTGNLTVETPIYLDGKPIQRSVNRVSLDRNRASQLAKGGR